MKLPTSIIITCVLSVLVASCTNRDPGLGKNPEVIKINIDDKKRPLLNVSIEDVVPLETSQNSLLGYQAKVKYFNNRFYILNNNRFEQPTLFVFDERGHFLKKTIRGKGPGEVIEPFAFTINEEDSVVLLHDQALRSNLTFDLDLNYINSEKHSNVFIKDFYRINRDTFLIYHHDRNTNFTGGKQYFTYTLYTEGFTKEKHLDILLNGDKDAQGLLSPVSITNLEVLFVAPWNYNIYQLVNGKERI